MTETTTPDTFTRRTVTAAELRPGDIVLTADGSARAYAAFDVDTAPDGQTVTVWTAVADYDTAGPTVTLPAARLLTVNRRDGGPRVTRQTIVVPTSAAPDDERWARDLDALGWEAADVHCRYCRRVLVKDYDGRGTGWSHWEPTPGTRQCAP
jgi:hypothetical protein